MKQLKLMDEKHTKFLSSPSVPMIFPQMHTSFPSVLPKGVYAVSLRMHSKFSQTKPAKHKKTSRDKITKRFYSVFSKKNHLEENRRRSGIRKNVATHKSNYLSRH